MSRADHLRRIVRTLMRVMLISERTPKAHQHVERYNALDFHTLGLLRETKDLRASELAAKLGVAPTTTSSLIARLVGKDLVSREKSVEDGRAIALRLTTQGKAMAQAIHDQDIKNMELFLSAMTEDEQDQLLVLLGKVAARVQNLESDAG